MNKDRIENVVFFGVITCFTALIIFGATLHIRNLDRLYDACMLDGNKEYVCYSMTYGSVRK